MSPPQRRALALALAALLLPLASAQGDPAVDPQEPVEPPQEVDCTAPLEECFPDLIPSNPRVAATDERYPATACTDFINVGQAPTATPFRVRVAVDGIPVGERQFSDVYDKGQGEANICFSGIMLRGGRHTLTVVVDPYGETPESDEGNNERGIAFSVAYTPGVDLAVTAFYVTPYEGAPRQNQVFVANVTNVGRAPSNRSTLSFSDDNGILANYTLPALAAGETRQMVHATRPETRPVGSFVARVSIDNFGENLETNESNHEAYTDYVVLEHPAADLVVETIELDGNFTEYRGVLANVTVRNEGDLVAREVRVWAFNESGAPLQEGYARTSLHPDATLTVQLRLVLRAGDRLIRFQVDPGNAIGEKDELDNNASIAMTITKPVVVIEEPNLVIERIYAMPDDPRPGEAVSVGALVRNVGTNRSNATSVNFTIDGRSIGSAVIPALAIDASYSAYVPWVAAQEGTFLIDAIADAPAKVRELDEEDNALALTFSVTPVVEEPETPPEEETPPVVPTPTPTPTPTTPTRPTTPAINTSDVRIAISDMQIETRPVPGGLKGIVTLSLRNPNTASIGLIEVTFKVDDDVLVTRLVNGIRSAASQPATTGEVDLPPGNHTVTVEVRIVGTQIPPVIRSQTYEVDEGGRAGIPGPSLGVTLALAVALALARRKR